MLPEENDNALLTITFASLIFPRRSATSAPLIILAKMSSSEMRTWSSMKDAAAASAPPLRWSFRCSRFAIKSSNSVSVAGMITVNSSSVSSFLCNAVTRSTIPYSRTWSLSRSYISARARAIVSTSSGNFESASASDTATKASSG